jgi:hypothetical protein
MPKATAASNLADRLLSVLKAQRDLGNDAYPLALERLIQLTDPHAEPKLIKSATTGKNSAFKAATIVASKKAPANLLALAEDTDRLARSPRLLEGVLEALCTPEKPVQSLAAVKKVVDKKLQEAFLEATQQRLAENGLPSLVGHQVDNKKPVLFLHKWPPKPPPPPPKKPEEILAEQLLTVLQAQRQLGGEAYPLTLKRLVGLTNPKAPSTVRNKALKHPVLAGRLFSVNLTKEESLIALAEDRAQLLCSNQLLEGLLRAKQKPNEHAFPLDALLPKKSDLTQPIREAVSRRIDTGTLPANLGWMWIGKKQHLFFLADIQRSAEPAQPKASSSPPVGSAPLDFAKAFDQAFNELNHKNGHNFVSLVELRKALPVVPATFDAELRKLRIAGRYTLSAAEGRHGITPEERAGGIEEHGSLLLYVSRKSP